MSRQPHPRDWISRTASCTVAIVLVFFFFGILWSAWTAKGAEIVLRSDQQLAGTLDGLEQPVEMRWTITTDDRLFWSAEQEIRIEVFAETRGYRPLLVDQTYALEAIPEPDGTLGLLTTGPLGWSDQSLVFMADANADFPTALLGFVTPARDTDPHRIDVMPTLDGRYAVPFPSDLSSGCPLGGNCFDTAGILKLALVPEPANSLVFLLLGVRRRRLRRGAKVDG